MENFKSPVPVEWSNRRVLTTAQLAKYYKCPVEHIRDNFRKNRDRFVAGKHYFKLEGEALKNFRDYTENFRLVENDYTEEGIFPVVPARTPSLYLWTERGAARHAKMLSTDRAWEVFEKLEDFYFVRNASALVAPAAKEKPAIKSERPQLKLARVYVLEMSDGSVKIGYTKRFCNRMSEIKRQSKLSVKKIFFTAIMSRENARLVERCTKEIFSSSKLGGEFFSVKFEAACAAVDSFAKMACVAPIVYSLKRGGKILKIAGRKFD